MTLLFALTRSLHLLSVMTLFGAGAFSWLQQSRLKLELRLPRALFALCAAIALATTCLSIGFVADEMTGNPGAIFDAGVIGEVVRHTLYGGLALVRIALLSAFLLVVWLRPGWLMQAGSLCAGMALLLLGPTSHASSAVVEPYKYVFAASDGVHLLAGGFWIGGLVALLPTILSRPIDVPQMMAALSLFSRWAMAAVALLVIAGPANAIAILDFRGMAWSHAYLTWLAIKVVIAAVMIALALTNRFGLMPGLARHETDAVQAFPFTVCAELGCAAAILLIVGILGLTSPMQM